MWRHSNLASQLCAVMYHSTCVDVRDFIQLKVAVTRDFIELKLRNVHLDPDPIGIASGRISIRSDSAGTTSFCQIRIRFRF